MSLRSDYELTVEIKDGDARFTAETLKPFIAACDYTLRIGGKDGDGGVISIQDEGRAFFLLLREIHPEAMEDAITSLSEALPGVTLEVEEYIREATEICEPGRYHSTVIDGTVYNLEADLAILRHGPEQLADPTLPTEARAREHKKLVEALGRLYTPAARTVLAAALTGEAAIPPTHQVVDFGEEPGDHDHAIPFAGSEAACVDWVEEHQLVRPDGSFQYAVQEIPPEDSP